MEIIPEVRAYLPERMQKTKKIALNFYSDKYWQTPNSYFAKEYYEKGEIPVRQKDLIINPKY